MHSLKHVFHLLLCSTGPILVLGVQTASSPLRALWLYLRLKHFYCKRKCHVRVPQTQLGSQLEVYVSVTGWYEKKWGKSSAPSSQAPNTVNHICEHMVSCNSFMNHPSSPWLDVLRKKATKLLSGRSSVVFIASVITYGLFCVWHTAYTNNKRESPTE